jgi:hypothetical protein
MGYSLMREASRYALLRKTSYASFPLNEEFRNARVLAAQQLALSAQKLYKNLKKA